MLIKFYVKTRKDTICCGKNKNWSRTQRGHQLSLIISGRMKLPPIALFFIMFLSSLELSSPLRFTAAYDYHLFHFLKLKFIQFR